MRNSVNNRKPATATLKQYVTFNQRPVPDKHRHSKRAKGPLARSMSWTLRGAVIAVSLFMGHIYANTQNDMGFAGVLSAKANGMPLSCGGEYDADTLGILHPSLPCGSLVQVLNPANGVSAVVKVISNKVMFNPNNHRNADLTSALATRLGLEAEAKVPAPVSLREYAGVNRFIPMTPAYQPALPEVPTANEASRFALTQNMLAECHICGTNGMIAVAQVTLNRTAQKYNGKTSLKAVVFDYKQFSWTLNPKDSWPGKGSKGWVANYVQAGAMLTDQQSAEELAIRYLIGPEATHYYAFDVMPTPYWGKRNGILEVVPMPNTLEVELRHRFFRVKGYTAPTPEASLAVANSNIEPEAEHLLPANIPVPTPRPANDQIAKLIRIKG